VLRIRPGGLRHGGRILTPSLSPGAAELALWPHVQFIKLVCVFQRTRFPGRFGLNTVSSQESLRELLSADRSGSAHPLCACEVWHGDSVIAPGSNFGVLFY